MAAKDKILTQVDQLIAEGREVLQTQYTRDRLGDMQIINPRSYVSLEKHAKWRAGCLNLIRRLGELGKTWAATFEEEGNGLTAAKQMFGTLSTTSGTRRDGGDGDYKTNFA